MLKSNFLCVHCLLEGLESKGDEVDHIIPLSEDITLAYDLDNLQYLCKKHHAIKTAKENGPKDKEI